MATRKSTKSQSSGTRGRKTAAPVSTHNGTFGDAVTNAAGVATHRAASFEQIQQRAYEIFLERGGAPGNEVGDWLAAERELLTVTAAKE